LKDDETEKGKTEELRQIILPMINFMIVIGSNSSDILATLTHLMGERYMLDKLEREGIYLILYSRYMDDISIIVDVINKEDKGKMFQ
jgi:hypothetical protein